MHKRWMVPGLVAAALIGIGGFGTLNAYAQTDDQSTVPPVIQKLVEKFGLKQAEVEQVFTEVRTERREAMNTKFSEQLDKLVADGKLTETQKQAILAKRSELQAQMQTQFKNGRSENWKNMTAEERKAEMATRKTEMEARRTAMEAWAKANGIDTQYLHLVMGQGFGGSKHGGPFGGNCPDGLGGNVPPAPEI